MSDYDLKFQAELERAQALSLESLALEQFRRQKRANSVSEIPTSDAHDGQPERPLRSRERSFDSSGTPPVLPPPPRRPSRSQQTPRSSCGEEQPQLQSQAKSTSNSPTRPETSDLISFTSPNSTKKAHDSLKEYIDQIHKLTQDTQEMVLYPMNGSNYPPNDRVPATPPYPPGASQHANYRHSVQSIQTMHSTYAHRQTAPIYPRLPVQPYNNPYMAGYRYHYPPPPNGPPPFNYPSYAPGQYAYRQPPPGQYAQPGYGYNPVTPPPASYPTQNYYPPNQYYTPPNLPPYAAGNFNPPPYTPSGLTTNSQDSSSNTNSQLDIFHTKDESFTGSSAVSEVSSNAARSDFSRRLSEISNTSENSNESNDTIVALRHNPNLIDLTFGSRSDGGNVRVSVLEAFDPLLINQSNSVYVTASEASSSVYDEFDPLDFLNEDKYFRETAIYSKKVTESVPSPPPKSVQYPSLTVKTSTTNKLYDSVTLLRTRHHDTELVAFLNMVKALREEFSYRDTETNPGYIVAARSNSRYPPNTSIKLLVHYQSPEDPVMFTCDVNSTVEHVIMHVVCEIDAAVKDDMSSYMLRVSGMSEYLNPGSSLCEYDYVRQCVRLEKDVLLCLEDNIKRTLGRTERDDIRDSLLTLEELVPSVTLSLTYDDLSILLETLEGELSRAIGTVASEGSCQPRGVFQAVKAICALAGGLETAHLTTTLAAFVQACGHGTQPASDILKPEIISDAGAYSQVTLRVAGARDAVALHCQRIRDAVRDLLALYTRTNKVDFRLNDMLHMQQCDIEKAIPIQSARETALFCIEAVHRLPSSWNYDDYMLSGQIFHGTRPLKSTQVTHPTTVENAGFYPRIMFDSWLNLEEIPIASLPRESRLVLTLYGRTMPGPENQGNGSVAADKSTDSTQSSHSDGQNHSGQHLEVEGQIEQIELGWSAIQIFNHDGLMFFGNFALPIWPVCTDKRLGPAPNLTQCPQNPHPVLSIEIPQYCVAGIKWPTDDADTQDECGEGTSSEKPGYHRLETLDTFTKNQIIHFVQQGPYHKLPIECREIIWDKRHYLVDIPEALPLMLSATINWDVTGRNQLMNLVKKWQPLAPYDAMHLLLPCFPDVGIRKVAVSRLSLLSDGALGGVLPQLVQALRYEATAGGPLARLLLRRSLCCPAIAHKLYWLLLAGISNKQTCGNEWLGISLEDNTPGTSNDSDPVTLMNSRWSYRYNLMMRALLTIIGENLSQRLVKQQTLIKGLSEVASNVKSCKENARMRTLVGGMENLAATIRSDDMCLPLSLSMEVNDIDIKSCSYFSSFTLPLKISFIGRDNATIPAMFKVGDDLRQDALVLQVIKLMDTLWLEEGLDLRMVTFQAVPTHQRKGMIQIVTEAETLRIIQTEFGLTGSFKDRPIAEWLAKHNPSELEYERARDNFTASCAGYSVATYLLGICDRHNDNIMLKTSGHLFHIDFGKFLGDAQMFGNFKRDRAPFVLTPDMAYVINDGERPSQRFHYFVELCCTAFNIVRRHHKLFLDLFALMATSGVPGVTNAAVNYVRSALLPGSSQAEAAAAFARLIHSSMKSKFTPINFFLHNLAQLVATGADQANSSSELLSFMPRTYTMLQDGRLISVEVLGFEKRYEPEKHYVYSLRIYRQGQATPSLLYRSYKHFYELYQKLCLHFPLAKVHNGLTQGMAIGRTTTRQVAERRLPLVQSFLHSLFGLADEVAHSDLIYTFFHPLLRDQQPVEPQRLKSSSCDIRNSNDGGTGALKISVQYTAGVLAVLILHAQSLAVTSQGVPPNPYVKVYLLPDPSKETKRKTRVLKRNSHPSFMEMLEYRLPLEVIRGRSLQATVWHYDPLQENQFLGGTILPLDSLPLVSETVAWYPLEYLPR